MFDDKQKQLLAEPLDPVNVKKREGADRRSLSYVEGWHIIDEANRIFGFDGWSSETVEIRPLHEPKLNTEKNNVVSSYFSRVRVSVYAGDRTIVREGCGAARGFAKTAGEAAENAAKGAETDALKRAFRTFGNASGLRSTTSSNATSARHAHDGRSRSPSNRSTSVSATPANRTLAEPSLRHGTMAPPKLAMKFLFDGGGYEQRDFTAAKSRGSSTR